MYSRAIVVSRNVPCEGAWRGLSARSHPLRERALARQRRARRAVDHPAIWLESGLKIVRSWSMRSTDGTANPVGVRCGLRLARPWFVTRFRLGVRDMELGDRCG